MSRLLVMRRLYLLQAAARAVSTDLHHDSSSCPSFFVATLAGGLSRLVRVACLICYTVDTLGFSVLWGIIVPRTESPTVAWTHRGSINKRRALFCEIHMKITDPI